MQDEKEEYFPSPRQKKNPSHCKKRKLVKCEEYEWAVWFHAIEGNKNIFYTFEVFKSLVEKRNRSSKYFRYSRYSN